MNQANQGASSQQAEKNKAIWDFRKLVERSSLNFNQEASAQINYHASYYHALCAQDFANVIMDEFIKVSNNQRKLVQAAQNQSANQITYLYIMDSVLKHVQGSYIAAFQQNLNFILHLVFQNQNSPDFKQRLKVFKCWQVLCIFHGLDEISRDLGLHRFVNSSRQQHLSIMQEQEMIDEESAAKIQEFGLVFYPLSIPFDVVMNPQVRIICGSHHNERDVRIKFLQDYQVPQAYWQNALSFVDIQPSGPGYPLYSHMIQPAIGFPQGYVTRPQIPQPQQFGWNGYQQGQPVQSQYSGQGQGGLGQEQQLDGMKESPQFIHTTHKTQNLYTQQSLPNQQHQFFTANDQNKVSTLSGIKGQKFGSTTLSGSTTNVQFLPSLLKSFHSFNKQLCLSIGNFVSQKTQTSNQLPNFNDLDSLCQQVTPLNSFNSRINQIAQAQLFESQKFQCKICGLRFNFGYKYRQHLDNHFNEHLLLDSRRPQFQSASEFQKSKKAVTGTFRFFNCNLVDQEVISYSNQTLCIVCKQRIELEHLGDDIVFKEGKQVTVDGKLCIAHTQCFQVMSKQTSKPNEESFQLGKRGQFDASSLKDLINDLDEIKKRQKAN